jgi:hypothetical protein
MNIQTVPDKFISLGDHSLTAKPDPEKWSKKEILGHLTDSAFNNLRRIIMVQYQPGVKIVYDQDQWVRIQRYQEMEIKDIVQLWIVLNQQFIHIIESFPETMLSQSIDTGKDSVEYCAVEFLITDYLDHMEHHLNQIFG